MEDLRDRAERVPGHFAAALSRLGGALADSPYWALSAVLHLLLLVALTLFARGVPRPEPGPRPLTLSLRPATKPARDPSPQPARKPGTPLFHVTPAPLEPPREETPRDEPRGTDLSRVLDAPALRAAGWGRSRALPRAYAQRRARSTLRGEGGSGATDDAVSRALEWLARHQSPDGSWKAAAFTQQCTTPCRNLSPTWYGDGRGQREVDAGVTALAMLAFTGSGYTHYDDGEGPARRFSASLRRAAGFLKRIQDRSHDPTTRGRYATQEHRKWIYDHAMATLAMGELLVMSRDYLGLSRSLREAVELCLRCQNPGGAWRYGYRPGDDDVSVTGWVVLPSGPRATHASASPPRPTTGPSATPCATWSARPPPGGSLATRTGARWTTSSTGGPRRRTPSTGRSPA